MKALSIRQPWAWMIIHGGKDFENRDWYTSVRGRILVHAAKGMTKGEYEDAKDTYDRIPTAFYPLGRCPLPAFEDLQRGGIIGEVEIVSCLDSNILDEKDLPYPSPFFFGRFGFKLQNPKPLPFRAYRGQLGFFEVDEQATREAQP